MPTSDSQRRGADPAWRLRSARGVRGLAVVLPVGLGVNLAAVLLEVVCDWHTAGTARAFVAGELDYRGAEARNFPPGLCRSAFVGQPLSFLLVTLVLLIWVHRARCNAEALNPVFRFAFSRRFAPWAPLNPVAGIWWSRSVLDELWRASRPDNGEARLRNAVVWAWWVCTALAVLLYFVGPIATLIYSGLPQVDQTGLTPPADRLANAVLAEAVQQTVRLGLSAVAAVLLTVVVRRITRWQATWPGGWSYRGAIATTT